MQDPKPVVPANAQFTQLPPKAPIDTTKNAVVVKMPDGKQPEPKKEEPPAKVEPKLEEQPLTVKDADRLAAFTKREAEFLRKEQEYKQKLTELDRLAQLEGKLKEDPYAVVEQFGGDIEKWAKRILNNNQPAPEEKISSLEKKLNDIANMLQQRQADEKRQRERSYVGEYASAVKKHFEAEDYKPVNQWLKAQSALIGNQYNIDADIEAGLQRAYYEQDPASGGWKPRENPRILTPPEFADTFKSEAKVRLDALIDSLVEMGLVTKAAAAPVKPAVEPPAQRPRALTNSLETNSTGVPDITKMSHEERIKYVAQRAQAGAYNR